MGRQRAISASVRSEGGGVWSVTGMEPRGQDEGWACSALPGAAIPVWIACTDGAEKLSLAWLARGVRGKNVAPGTQAIRCAYLGVIKGCPDPCWEHVTRSGAPPQAVLAAGPGPADGWLGVGGARFRLAGPRPAWPGVRQSDNP